MCRRCWRMRGGMQRRAADLDAAALAGTPRETFPTLPLGGDGGRRAASIARAAHCRCCDCATPPASPRAGSALASGFGPLRRPVGAGGALTLSQQPQLVADRDRDSRRRRALRRRYGPRSGLSQRGVEVSWGTVDADYRGELLVGMFAARSVGARLPRAPRRPHRAAGDRAGVLLVDVAEVGQLPDTERGADGFGSTGRLRRRRC